MVGNLVMPMFTRLNDAPNKIFVDADAIVSLAIVADKNHQKAVEINELIQRLKIKTYISNLAMGEAITVISQESGIEVATKVGEEIINGGVIVIYTDREQSEKGLVRFSKQTSKNSRFTDVVNMIMMDELKIDTIFSFDKHYLKNGYKLLI